MRKITFFKYFYFKNYLGHGITLILETNEEVTICHHCILDYSNAILPNLQSPVSYVSTDAARGL